MNNLTVLSMERKTLKRLLKIADFLFNVMFVIMTLICIIRFVNAEDVIDKIDYGIWFVILLILALKE
jgi:uncharacterized membrane protein